MALSLKSIAFRDAAAAERNFRAISGILSEPALRTLRQSLRQSPDPDASLNYLERFLKQTGGEDESLLPHGNRLPIVTAVFGNSQFLAETLFRYPELLAWALDESRLYRLLSTDELRSELGWFPSDTGDDEAARTLARFKRMHLLRIVIRDLFRFATLADVTEELSNLADAILQGAQEHIHQQLVRRFGRPLTQADSGPIESHFVVLALGKLGGRELNYSSDIDLMYLYTAEAETSGPVKIPGREFFGQLAQRLTRMLSKITPEGSCFRVDLRLRPEGGSGELALPLSSALKYYHSRARDWELQMLIKARPVAGDRPLGNTFLAMLEPRIYQTTTDFSLIERVAETRDRIQKKLSGDRDNGLNIKLSRGGIRDIEFLVQCLQRLHGGREPWVRAGGTLLSLHRLRDKGYLSPQDYSRLHGAYSYLRTLEHRLQIEHNRQTHTIPSRPEPRLILTRKMYGKSSPHADSLGREVERHLRKVSEIYERVIGGQRPIEPAAAPPVDVVDARPDKPASDPSWLAQIQHLEQQSPRLAETIADLPIRWGRKHFEHFLNNLISVPGLLKTFEAQPDLMRCVGDLIEHSPHLAEQIIRNPAEAAELSTVVAPDSANADNTDRDTIGDARHSDLSDSTELRRFYRRRMLEILARSVYRREAVFATLDKTSRLAEFVIQQALRIATAGNRAHSRSTQAGRAAPGHRPWASRHARIRPRLRRRSRVCAARRRGIAHQVVAPLHRNSGRHHEQLYARGHAVHYRQPPEADGARRPADPNRVAFQAIPLGESRSLGSHHLHESPHDRRGFRPRDQVPHRAARRGLATLWGKRRPGLRARRHAQEDRRRAWNRSTDQGRSGGLLRRRLHSDVPSSPKCRPVLPFA